LDTPLLCRVRPIVSALRQAVELGRGDVAMNDTSTAFESLKLIADWAKWLITIETGAIAIIGGVIKGETASSPSIRAFATGAIGSFVISISAAALLLLTLPDIAQNLRPQVDVWLTSDTVVGRVFHLTTQDIAVLESFFFGIGILCFAGLILTITWSRTANPVAAVAIENASTPQPAVKSRGQTSEDNSDDGA
jgi:hypothetical protein